MGQQSPASGYGRLESVGSPEVQTWGDMMSFLHAQSAHAKKAEKLKESTRLGGGSRRLHFLFNGFEGRTSLPPRRALQIACNLRLT